MGNLNIGFKVNSAYVLFARYHLSLSIWIFALKKNYFAIRERSALLIVVDHVVV